ncbi:uncharacterized protein At4g14100-like isoform X1 [Cucurbita pepo subsp. pepo]|uniref:uncharacterized protein At4g14100-like isoform X1 n=1 Tax=Cucurbita pepo subsp. pepo TaxID=3664 RepID=UPI000C9D5913|nr:uncharacterized protein At4g14100-like isoform X1 [Cucurbita pepo subsp. pepo]
MVSKATFFLVLSLLAVSVRRSVSEDPIPTPWPLQFHSILFMNYSGILQIIDLWYDWPNGRNFNIIQHQLGNVLYDLEWNNGTSFFYTLDSSKTCSSAQLEVGILRPNWLDGANYLGQRHVNGFLCNVWEKVDFIWYYEDVETKRPVHWVFYTGRQAHVMTFEVGAVLEDEKWQAPVYCFDGKGGGANNGVLHQNLPVMDGVLRGSLFPAIWNLVVSCLLPSP